MLERIQQTTSYLRTRLNNEIPKAVIVLGSGLGQLANEISDKTVIPYSEIPNFPVSTVEGHAGNLIIGELAGQRVLAMQGRFHYYEGYDMKEVTFPMR
ncbi:MAG: purine-nucleoside phosphorylase, partial [Paludibacteraceae bacterium]|nr:purine-nucleoside phosphorylase [Paludibacteraceae bacterium]